MCDAVWPLSLWLCREARTVALVAQQLREAGDPELAAGQDYGLPRRD